MEATAPRIIVPVSRAENLAPDREQKPFPKGPWVGTIEEVRKRPLTYLSDLDAESLAKRGYASADVEAFSIQFGSNTALEGQEDVGARKFFSQDIVIRDGTYTLENAADAPESAWQIRERAQAFIANLANALGAVDVVETPDGEAYAVAEGFIEAFFGGQYDGTPIGFEVEHRPWKSKASGKSGTEELVKAFFPAP